MVAEAALPTLFNQLRPPLFLRQLDYLYYLQHALLRAAAAEGTRRRRQCGLGAGEEAEAETGLELLQLGLLSGGGGGGSGDGPATVQPWRCGAGKQGE